MGNKDTDIRSRQKSRKDRFAIRDKKILENGPILVDVDERDALSEYNIEPSILKKIAVKDSRQ